MLVINLLLKKQSSNDNFLNNNYNILTNEPKQNPNDESYLIKLQIY